MIRLLIGGSPCTHWSIAQTKNRETTAEGVGWELFKNYLIALEKYKPDYFLYENNKSMSSAIREQITRELGVEPIMINSALVSAQSRQRLYWTNIPGVDQPEDMGILLRDILESGVHWREKAYTLRASAATKQGISNIVKHTQTGGKFGYQGVYEPIYSPSGKLLTEAEMDYMVRETKGGRNHFAFEYFHDAGQDKGATLTANTHKGVPYNVCAEPIRIGTIESDAKNEDFDSQQYRVYSPDGKAVTLCGQGGGVGAKTGLYATPVRVGDMPNAAGEISGSQSRLVIVDAAIFNNILSHVPDIRTAPLEVLSMYDGMACGHIALDKLGGHITRYFATEIDKYAIQTTMHNFPDVIQMGDAYQVRADDWSLPAPAEAAAEIMEAATETEEAEEMEPDAPAVITKDTEKIGAVIKYPGAKWRLADWIIGYFPKHRSYLEPFFGSGAVLFRKDRSPIETVNDMDGDVVNLFEWIRKDPERLAREIALTPYARDEYERAYAAQYTETDSYQRAVNFYIRMMMGHGFRMTGEKVGWKNDVQGREAAYAVRQWGGLPETIIKAAERLLDVQIENRPALDLIRRFNYPNVLIYADPPYVLSTRYGAKKQYRHEMTDDDHMELLEALKAHTGPVIISGYDNPIYNDALRDWYKTEKAARTQTTAPRVETIWMNFKPEVTT